MHEQTNCEAKGDSAKYRDLSLPELFDMFPDDKAAMEWIEENVWPDGRRCPRCGYKYTVASLRHVPMP